MQIVKTIDKLRPIIREVRLKNKLVGFVPTMGALHPGHISLLKASKKECDCTVLSIYVNPIQFDNQEDMKKYPGNLEADEKIARQSEVDILFLPDDKQMYSNGFSTYVEVGGDLTNTLCGISRPGHFCGVATVVSKLFNIVQPDKAYFGMKDAQQAFIISKMVNELNLPVDIRLMPIVREEDGLACSSRNKNLSNQEYKNALVLNSALCHADKRIMEDRENKAMKITTEMYDMVNSTPGTNVDYISIVSVPSLKEIKEIKGNIMIAMAVFVGKTRLIDNITLQTNKKSK